MDDSSFYELREAVSNNEIFIKQQFEKIDIKISHIEEKISGVKEDIGDIKSIIKELEKLRVEVNAISKENDTVDYKIDNKIHAFRKEMDERKYKDWRLWLGVAGLAISVVLAAITIYSKIKGAS